MLLARAFIVVLGVFSLQCSARAFASCSDGLEKVQSHIEEIEDLNKQLAGFQGGLVEMLALHGTMNALHLRAQETREMITPMSNFTVDEEETGKDYISRLLRAYTEGLITASSIKRVVKRIPHGRSYSLRMVDKISQEKDEWEHLLLSKVSPEAYQIFIPELERAEMEHRNLLRAYGG